MQELREFQEVKPVKGSFKSFLAWFDLFVNKTETVQTDLWTFQSAIESVFSQKLSGKHIEGDPIRGLDTDREE